MNNHNTNCPDWLIFAYKSRLISESKLDEIWLKLIEIWSKNNQPLAVPKWELIIPENKFKSPKNFGLIYPPSFDLTLLH